MSYPKRRTQGRSELPPRAPSFAILLAMCGQVGAGMRDLGHIGIRILPCHEEILIAFTGSLVIPRFFTGECNAIKGKSGMRTLNERPLERRFGVGPFARCEHGGVSLSPTGRI